MPRCVICGLENEGNGSMCRRCGRSYDRYGIGDGSILAAMEWAAARSRRLALRAAQTPGTGEGGR
jgi:hypothetical protein